MENTAVLLLALFAGARGWACDQLRYVERLDFEMVAGKWYTLEYFGVEERQQECVWNELSNFRKTGETMAFQWWTFVVFPNNSLQHAHWNMTSVGAAHTAQWTDETGDEFAVTHLSADGQLLALAVCKNGKMLHGIFGRQDRVSDYQLLNVHSAMVEAGINITGRGVLVDNTSCRVHTGW